MAGIHGSIFLVLGMIIAVVSKVIDSGTGTSSMVIFFFAGIIMAMFGVAKLVIFRGKKIEDKTIQRPQQPITQSCPNCKTRVSSAANFCYNCGNRLR